MINWEFMVTIVCQSLVFAKLQVRYEAVTNGIQQGGQLWTMFLPVSIATDNDPVVSLRGIIDILTLCHATPQSLRLRPNTLQE